MKKITVKISSVFLFIFFGFATACTPLTPHKIELTSALIQATGVMGYWNFNETTLGTAPNGADFADSSGNHHDATAVGTLLLGTAGVSGTAITSTGSGSVMIPIDLSSETTVTLSIWVNQHITRTNTSNVLFEYTPNSTTSSGFFAGLDDNSGSPLHSFLFWIHGVAGFYSQYTPTLPSGWHNVFVTYDQSNPSQNTITLAIDGVHVSTTEYESENSNNSGVFANSNLYLLCRGGTSLCLNADIDELIIWNRSVSLSELEAIYPF